MRSLDELVADLTSPDESAAEAAVSELSRCGDSAAPRILRLLHSEVTDHRWWAIRALAAMPHARADWFVKALEDDEAEIRAAAALALATRPDTKAVPPLVRALEDAESLVSILAVKALVKIGSAAVPHLIAAYGAAGSIARINIMRALADLRDHRAIKLMLSAMENESAAVQYWAQQGLDNLGLNMVYMMPD